MITALIAIVAAIVGGIASVVGVLVYSTYKITKVDGRKFWGWLLDTFWGRGPQ